MRRVNLNQPSGSGKPEVAIVCAPRGRVAVGSCLAAAEAVGIAKLDPVSAIGLAVQWIPIAARNAVAGGEPQAAAAIVQDCMNAGLPESVVQCREEILPIPQIPAVVLRSNQKLAIGASQQRRDHI